MIDLTNNKNRWTCKNYYLKKTIIFLKLTEFIESKAGRQGWLGSEQLQLWATEKEHS